MRGRALREGDNLSVSLRTPNGALYTLVCVYKIRFGVLMGEGHLSVAKPEAPPPIPPPLWADAFYKACNKKIEELYKSEMKLYNSVSVYEGNGGVARKGWGAGEGTTGFATPSGPFPA